MKLNILDLLDEYLPEQELELIKDNNNSINLNRITRLVNKKIAKTKGGQLMHIRKIAAACLIGLTVLTLGSITVNAATNGALFNSVKVLFIDRSGIYKSMEPEKTYVNKYGEKVTEYTLEGEEDVIFAISGDVDASDQLIISSSENTSLSEAIGINLEKYKDYTPGTYEETNSEGNTYVIEVSDDGTICVNNKE